MKKQVFTKLITTLYFKPGQSFSLQGRSSPTQSAPEGAGGSGKLGGVGKLGWAEEG